ncbi:MAG TPA: ABC transporter permease [Candidatus Faeciplasma pullistercoris]|uniref:ABC transporter permease n=1 Tax=Candidatus Faeciplasma pullistercoris TaxID=2840800 RepID=A0A9D1KJG1_9FIRM|nr:ABC transporter permease [Candidatus Faeciplasma pullistercoris]
MEMTRALKFETPSFTKRLRGMLGVDFYRLFHTPMFYIFLVIAAIIPAMILGTSGSDTAEGVAPLYTNTWQIIAADTPIYAVSDMGQYANMNMVFIFGGIMVSIFIGHDYKSGYVKQLFTTHAKKQDYMMSKTITCAFAMACMCITYLMGGVVAGFLAGTSFEVNVGSLIIAIVSKMIMSLGWASLYTFLNIIFRRYFGISIASSFFFGTGILIIGAGAIVGNSSILNIFLYGSSVYACLSSNIMTLLVCLVVSVAWAIIYNLLGTLILSKSDVY